MFVLRLAFWLGLVVMLLPKESDMPTHDATDFAAMRAVAAHRAESLLSQAGDAVNRVSTACERDPALCMAVASMGTAAAGLAQQALAEAQRQAAEPDLPHEPGTRVHRP